MQEKVRKERRKEKKKSRKQGTKIKKIVLKASPYQQIFPFLLQSRDGDLVTPSAIFLLPSLVGNERWYQVSLLLAVAVDASPPAAANKSTKKPNKAAWTRGP